MRTPVAASLIVLSAAAGFALAGDMSAVNGYQVQARIFNDFAGSDLNINGVPYPAPAFGAIGGQAGPVIFDEVFPQGIPGNFANKHVAWLSADGGATRIQTSVGQTWSIQFTVNMTAPASNGNPRKEAGIEIHQPRPGLGYTDEGQVLIASDNGEVAVFGATMPFTGFGAGAYTLGTTAFVLFEYFAPGVYDPAKGAYRLQFLDAVTGLHDSGLKLWGNEPDGIVGLTNAYVGLKDQNQRSPFVTDAVRVEYNGIRIIPSPGTLAMLGLGGLLTARRRR
jgi:hypothetical protein